MFIALYTLKIVYICVVMMCSTCYCLCHPTGSMEYVCVCVCVCKYVCLYILMCCPVMANTYSG